jgi:hypothetical protein|mmetsp:Transcript_108104/g.170895  ORF Transcript_108104/g.170895 Transcript_108104/m.170895 type:complete len:84 (-) Transcript_108104:1327-1578(-)
MSSSQSRDVGKIVAIGTREHSADFRDEERLELRNRAEVAVAFLPRPGDAEYIESQLELLLAERFGPTEFSLRDAAAKLATWTE